MVGERLRDLLAAYGTRNIERLFVVTDDGSRRVDGDGYVSVGWTIDTRDGRGVRDVLWYDAADVNDEFLAEFRDVVAGWPDRGASPG